MIDIQCWLAYSIITGKAITDDVFKGSDERVSIHKSFSYYIGIDGCFLNIRGTNTIMAQKEYI